MTSFDQVVASWHDFYMMVGTAAATLVGLLFVSLSLNARVIEGEANTGARLMAAQTFANFLSVLTFAVLFLVPSPGRWGLGLPLAAIGAVGLFGSIRRGFSARRAGVRKFGRRSIARHLVWSALCYVALVVVAVSLVLGVTDGLYWLIPVMLILIAGASQNAWELLLVRPEESTVGGPPSAA